MPCVTRVFAFSMPHKKRKTTGFFRGVGPKNKRNLMKKNSPQNLQNLALTKEAKASFMTQVLEEMLKICMSFSKPRTCCHSPQKKLTLQLNLVKIRYYIYISDAETLHGLLLCICAGFKNHQPMVQRLLEHKH